MPELTDAYALYRQHAILQAIQVLPVDRRHKLPRDQAQEDARGEVVFPEPVAELEVLGEGLRERQGYGLACCQHGSIVIVEQRKVYLQLNVRRRRHPPCSQSRIRIRNNCGRGILQLKPYATR